MDKIEFKIITQKYYHYDLDCELVDIIVNGKNFLQTVCKFEKSLGHQDGGGYRPIIPQYLYTDLIDGYKDDSIFIYDCGCGSSGCNPFCVFVDVGDKTVTWYDFMTSKEYFDDLCKENNFAMFKARMKNFGGLPPLVFDKKQYFDAVGVLRDWIFNEDFNITYGGIDCGYLQLNFKTPQINETFIFDELLSDPIPQLVKLFNYIQDCIEFDRNYDDDKRGIDISIGYNCEIELGETYDDRITAIKIVAEHRDWRNLIKFESSNKKISIQQSYLCIEWAEMFKKLFSDLLNDKYFPYSYPCFWYICEDTDNEQFDELESKAEKLHPDWCYGDILNLIVSEGKFSLSDKNKIFLEDYKKMLTDYVVPEGWVR